MIKEHLESGKHLQILEDFQKEVEWLRSNNDIKSKYREKFVAVQDQTFLDNDKDLRQLLEKLRKKGIDPSIPSVQYIMGENQFF